MRPSQPTRHRCPRRNQRCRSYARQRGRLRATTRQRHAADTAVRRGLFVGRRAKAAITGREIRGASEDRLMPIQSRRPQGHIGWSLRVDIVRRDDLMFRFLNRDELAELVRRRNLALANGLGVRFEEAQDFVGTWVSPPRRRARV